MINVDNDQLASQRSVVDLLDALESMVAESRRLPFTASVVVNEDELVDLIDRARLSLPEEVVQARHTLGDRQRILDSATAEAQALLESADAEARRLVEDATTRAEQMVSDHEVMRSAQARAEALVIEAETRAAEVTSEADGYARQVMTSLEEQLSKSLTTVRNGIGALPSQSKRRRK